MEKSSTGELLSNVYILYFKAKIALSEAHLMRSPKNFNEKFGLGLPPEYDIDITDYLVRKESPSFNQLSRQSWILFVLEITKLLSNSKSESFSIKKLYNKLFYKEFKDEVDLSAFIPILDILKNNGHALFKLKILRDRFYAHTDAEVGKMTDDIFPTYDEVWEIMFTIETFLKQIYGQFDSDVELDVKRFLIKYIRDFQRHYRYFQTTNEIGELYRLKRYLGEAKFTQFRAKIVV